MNNKITETKPQAQDLLPKMGQMDEMEQIRTMPKRYVKDNYFSRIFKSNLYDLIKCNEAYCWLIMDFDGKQSIIEKPPFSFQLDENLTERVVLAEDIGHELTASELIQKIKYLLSLVFCFKQSHHLNFCAIYTFATWLYEIHPEISYFAIIGEPGTGKSCLIDAMEQLCFRGHKVAESSSESVFFRNISRLRGTALWDEAQEEASNSSGRLHKTLTAGNKHNGHVEVNTQAKDKEHVPTRFPVFCPKIFGGRAIPGDDAILSRTYKFDVSEIDKDELPLFRVTDNKWLKEASKTRNDLMNFRQRKLLGLSGNDDSNLKALQEMKVTPREIQINRWLFTECPQDYIPFLVEAVNLQISNKTEDLRWVKDSQILITTYNLLKISEGWKVYLRDIQKAMKDSFPTITTIEIGKVLRANKVLTPHDKTTAFVDVNFEVFTKALLKKRLITSDI